MGIKTPRVKLENMSPSHNFTYTKPNFRYTKPWTWEEIPISLLGILTWVGILQRLFVLIKLSVLVPFVISQIKPSKVICNKDRDHICIRGMMTGPLQLEFITFPLLSKVTSSRSLCPIKVAQEEGMLFFLMWMKLLLLSPVESTLLAT